MSSIIAVRKKILSTKATKKITQAMELVAANKMKFFERRALSARAYAWDLLRGLKASSAVFENLSYSEKRIEGKTVFVLITSDKGLCGSLNQKLINLLFSSEKWKDTPEDERVLITIGKKSSDAAKREGISVAEKFDGISETMNSLDALKVAGAIVKFWDEGSAREVVLISPHYVNPFTTHFTEKTYLPFTGEMIETHLKWSDLEERQHLEEMCETYSGTILEPSEERMASLLAHQLIETLFVQVFYELKAAEYSSRMVAMKNATDSADDIIENLTREYNKTRQAVITRELAELSAAGEAMK